ncbi:MAG: DMT family transporter [Promethearchaeota archaeon]
MNNGIEDSKEKKASPSISKLCMLMSATCMGSVGLFVTLLGNYQVYTIVLLRGIFGALFLTFFMIKTHSFSREFLNESFKLHSKPLIISGLVYPVVIYFYFYTITIHGYAIAAFLLYTSGIFVLIFIIITKMDDVSKISMLSFIVALIGVATIMEFWNDHIFSFGLFTGLLSGLALGIFVFYKKIIYKQRISNSQNLKAKGDFDVFLAWWHLLFLIFPFLLFGAVELLKLTFIDILIAMLLGLIPTALAFALYNAGVKNDKGGNIIILSYIEPIVATILTILVVKSLSIFTIIGGALILIANIMVLKFSPERNR